MLQSEDKVKSEEPGPQNLSRQDMCWEESINRDYWQVADRANYIHLSYNLPFTIEHFETDLFAYTWSFSVIYLLQNIIQLTVIGKPVSKPVW